MQEPISSNNGSDSENTNIKVKVPKRILHFSDGTLEEYSDDEVDNTPTKNKNCQVVDPRTLSWGPWLGYKALAACDYLGETLASILGITTPKYWFEIEEYKRMQAKKLKQQQEAQGWSEPAAGVTAATGDIKLEVIKTEQLGPVSVQPGQPASTAVKSELGITPEQP